MINVQDWGRCPYRAAWQMQKALLDDIMSDPLQKDDQIVMVEHPAVYTLGFHGNASNMVASATMLESLGVECIRIERGGDITYHGPGQLVVYPVIYLHRYHLGVRKYVELLEDSVIELLKRWNINASSNQEAIGVWVDWGEPAARKICAIGVKVSHGVTMHGLALNVNTDLDAFSLINPCGFTDKGVTSMKKELGSPVDFDSVKKELSVIMIRRLSESGK